MDQLDVLDLIPCGVQENFLDLTKGAVFHNQYAPVFSRHHQARVQ
jgi:hypothetical protein